MHFSAPSVWCAKLPLIQLDYSVTQGFGTDYNNNLRSYNEVILSLISNTRANKRIYLHNLIIIHLIIEIVSYIFGNCYFPFTTFFSQTPTDVYTLNT
jgi:hypothetical protein